MRALAFFASLIYLQVSFASPFADHPFYIPAANILPPASDLEFEGSLLYPSEALELQRRGYDLSLLNPDANTDLWEDSIGKEVLANENNIAPSSELEFVNLLESPIGSFRFNVLVKEANGVETLKTILISRRSNTFLMRKALLEKIGYKIPQLDRLANVRIRFKNSFEKENFITDSGYGFNTNMGEGQAERWILNLKDTNSLDFEIQDVLIMSANFEVINMAMAFVNPSTAQGRRIFNALIIPYNLVDVQETVNGFRWYSARKHQNAIYVPLEEYLEFAASHEDAKWAVRRIAKLSREDFVEIVKFAQYPHEAALLLTEKLISRRNELVRLFELSDPPLHFNPMISFGQDLQNGKLFREEWEGYASRFALGEYPSPISGPEVRAFFKSKAIGSVISDLVRRVNMDLMPKTDIEKLAIQKQQDKLLKNLIRFAETGEASKTKFGIWTEPVFSTQVVAGREVVAGSFLGADNRVQLVDTFGFGADTGLYFGTYGLKPDQFLDAQAKVFYMRQYSHLRPLNKLDDALNVPYKNILVPLLKREAGFVFDELLTDEFKNLPEEEKNKRLNALKTTFRDTLGDGESIIISDSLGGLASLRAGYRFTERLSAQAQLASQMMDLSRLHIMRVGDKIHIYKDRGNVTSLSFTISLRAEIEVLEIGARFAKGKAEVDFYDLELNGDLTTNPDLILKLLSLREVFVDNSLSQLKSIQEPNRLRHHFKQTSSQFKILFFNHFNLDTTTRVEVQQANAPYSEHFISKLEGKRNGSDFQTLGVDIINYLIQESVGEDLRITNTTSGDPGDTFHGKSKSRHAYFEGALGQDPKASRFEESFVAIVYRWKGWQTQKKSLEKIIKEIAKDFDYNFYHPQSLHLVKQAELYALNLRLSIFDRGIRHMAALPQEEVNRIFANYNNLNNQNSSHMKRIRKAYISFLNYQKRYNESSAKGKTEKMAEYALSMVSTAESILTVKGLTLAVGGDKNIFVQTNINGFLKGEDGLLAGRSIEGSSLEQVASPNINGPLTAIQQELKMTESEFFIYWLIRRI